MQSEKIVVIGVERSTLLSQGSGDKYLSVASNIIHHFDESYTADDIKSMLLPTADNQPDEFPLVLVQHKSQSVQLVVSRRALSFSAPIEGGTAEAAQVMSKMLTAILEGDVDESIVKRSDIRLISLTSRQIMPYDTYEDMVEYVRRLNIFNSDTELGVSGFSATYSETTDNEVIVHKHEIAAVKSNDDRQIALQLAHTIVLGGYDFSLASYPVITAEQVDAFIKTCQPEHIQHFLENSYGAEE